MRAAARIRPDGDRARLGWATAAAAALVSQQVLGKALRDTLFLAAFGLEALPSAMAAAAVGSAALVLALSRAAVRQSPRRLVRVTLLASAGLLLAAWGLAGASPRAAAALVYVHAGVLSAATASVFWSLVSESFDPYTARAALPRVLTGATLGGVAGGLATSFAASWLHAEDLLPVAAALNLLAVATLAGLPGAAQARAAAGPGRELRSAVAALPYFGALALLVVSGAAVQGVLDWLLSSAALATLGKGPPLLRFFAAFQTAVGALSFLIQLRVCRRALERLGVGAVLSASPGALLGAVAVSLAAPPLAGAVLVRGVDAVLGASLYRSAYEVLFSPVEVATRRAWKPLLDVLGDKAGMLLGSGLVALVLTAAPGRARALLLAAVAALALARLALAVRLQGGYRRVLADHLRGGRLELSSSGVLDRGTVGALTHAPELDRATVLAEIERFRARAGAAAAPAAELGLSGFDLPGAPEPVEAPGAEGPAPAWPAPEDRELRALGELASGVEPRIRAALAVRQTSPLLATQVVRLVADDRVARAAVDWLDAQRPFPVGLLTDALLDPALPAPGRRRIARVLGKCDDPRAADGLLAALPAAPAAVRSGLAQALARSAARRPLPEAPLIEAAARAAAEGGELEDVFRLLAAAYPGEPVEAALRALSGPGDARGTALEWLSIVLPEEVRLPLWPRIAPGAAAPAPRLPDREALRRRLARTAPAAAAAAAEESDEG